MSSKIIDDESCPADSLISDDQKVNSLTNERLEFGEKEVNRIKTEENFHAVRHPTSFVETLIHVLKGNIGSGMFSMGEAFKNGGLLLSPPLTVFLGVICIYNNHVLLRAAEFVKDKFRLKHNPNFAETVELCFKAGPEKFKMFSDHVRVIVKVFVSLTQLGFCCVYICVVSETLLKILPSVFGHDMAQKEFMGAIFPPILVTSLITSLKFLAPVSMGSNVCVFGAVFVTLFVAIRDGSASISDRTAVGSLSALPLLFGKVIYSFEGIGLILPLRNEMRKPEQFGGSCGVLNIGMSVICTLLVVVGFVGYLSYGEDVKSSLSLNIPENEWIGLTVQVMMCLGLLFSYPLQFYVAADIIWEDINTNFGPFKDFNRGKLLTRICIVIVTFVVAAIIPDVGLFIALIGSVCATALALIFPALLEAAMSSEKPPSKMAVCLAVITLLLATFAFVTGTYSSIVNMISPDSNHEVNQVKNISDIAPDNFTEIGPNNFTGISPNNFKEMLSGKVLENISNNFTQVVPNMLTEIAPTNFTEIVTNNYKEILQINLTEIVSNNITDPSANVFTEIIAKTLNETKFDNFTETVSLNSSSVS